MRWEEYMHGILVHDTTGPHPKLIRKRNLRLRTPSIISWVGRHTKTATFWVFVSKSALTRITVCGSPSSTPNGTITFLIPNLSNLSVAIFDNTPTVNIPSPHFPRASLVTEEYV